MNGKKIKIIVVSAVLFLLIVSFFLIKLNGNKIPVVNNPDSNTISKLKSHYPELSAAQLEFYAGVADKGNIASCIGRDDESACLSSVAFLKRDRYFCNSLEEDEPRYKICIAAFLKETAKIEISDCNRLADDKYYNCLGNIFSTYGEIKDCDGLPELGSRIICQDFFIYKEAYSKYDKALCGKVASEKLNQYCLKNIIDKNQDSDSDGLTDLDEINKYKTHYLFSDSDSDGLTDGEEVKKYKTDPRNPDTFKLGMTDGEAVRRGLIKAK